ncbi:oxygen-dependent coproporphyrinogen oxidase [Xanthovirga aplysinae]|uniref:oxygen-dependent coproporphyrinogen oxidase n=1 Tax=Xanthovirga aplysinae TaxID=2529853 RepID=UPI0012BBC09C|nr:oxygen-dependent coproporphyrinogen oxidase [Xanthovirga aplysinae]MTI33180.1 oxygen-dependent coproporphyrinogen oxidase [Xanthovirga aplysinae]
MKKEEIEEWFKSLQENICKAIEKTDGQGKFEEDLWKREGGGGGRTRVLRNGAIIEKGGVNFSAVHGETPERILQALKLSKSNFFATGVSIVMHPQSPMVPIIHMNVRYFEMDNGKYWFGGGIDLTPHYIDKVDAQYFHQQLKAVCDKHHPDYYSKFKKWADDYFFIKHRNETRGIGGIFFDHLVESEKINKEECFAFVQDVGRLFAPIYTHLMAKNNTLPFGEEEKKWQFLRRGRYAEFNLVWDKGTKFGLDTNGRTESILMSLPPQANWEYNFVPQPNSKEAKTLELLKKGINWIQEVEG